MLTGNVDLTIVAHSFPQLEQPLIEREHFLDSIDSLFTAARAAVVLLEGDERSGKTVLAAQFARRHRGRAISLFLQGSSRFACDPVYVRQETGDQIRWAVGAQGDPNSASLITENEYNSLVFTLQRQAKREPFYFVIDGLDHVSAEQLRKDVLNTVPLGFTGFKMLITTSDEFPVTLGPEIERKTYRTAGFTKDEARIFLDQPTLSDAEVEAFTVACRRLPGHLADVRRLLKTGESASRLLGELHSRMPSLFEIEWRRREEASELQNLLLATVTSNHRVFTCEALARITNCAQADVRSTLGSLSFIRIDTQVGTVEYVSEPFRAFATQKLQHLIPRVRNLHIDDLLRDPTGEAAVQYLPTYYREADRLDDLLGFLDPTYFSAALSRCQSASPLRHSAHMGVEAAIQRHRDDDLLKFAAQESAFKDLGGEDMIQAQVEALIAMGDYSGAMAAAHSALLNEDRLHLLAIVVKGLKEAGAPVEATVLLQIRDLYAKVDRASLGHRATEIASDLMYAAPDLAVGLIEDAATTERDLESRDRAYAILAMSARAVDQFVKGDEEQKASRQFHERIRNPSVKRFSAAAAVLVGRYSGQTLINEVGQLEDTKTRILLMKHWARQNLTHPDAADVMEYALKVMVERPEYVPNSGDANDLMAPLPYICDDTKAASLLGRLDGMRGSFERNGSTVEYVQLQLLMAHAEFRHNLPGCADRLIDTFITAESSSDLSVRSQCFASIVANLARMDPQKSMEPATSLHTESMSKFDKAVKDLLKDTFDHFRVARPIIACLASDQPEMARNVALSLNTESRRDRSLAGLVDGMRHSPSLLSQLHLVDSIIYEIKESRAVDQCTLDVLETVSRRFVSGPLPHHLLPIADRATMIGDAEDRCIACCHATATIARSQDCENQSPRLATLAKTISDAVDSIDIAWVKIRTAFRAARALAKVSSELAQRCLTKGQQLMQTTRIHSEDAANSFSSLLHLTIAAAAGLFLLKTDTEDDLLRLRDLINDLPSEGERVVAWADIASQLLRANRSDEARRVVNEHVRVHLDRIEHAEETYRHNVYVTVAPVLFVANEGRTRDEIVGMPMNVQDIALDKIAQFLLYREPLLEPCDSKAGAGREPDYDDLWHVSGLLLQMNSDGLVYSYVERIADILTSDRNLRKYTVDQRSAICGRLRAAAARFPNPRFIAHNGYRIAAEAEILRIAGGSHAEWRALVDQGRALSNAADRTYVLTLVAGCMPGRESDLRERLLKEAKDGVPLIPVALERTNRLNAIAEAASKTNRELSKLCLKEAMLQALPLHGSDADEARRHVIDVAHGLNHEYADALVQLLDPDPARKREREILAKRVKTLEAKRLLNEKRNGESKQPDIPSAELPALRWDWLGSLNAGRLAPMDIESLRDDMSAAAAMPLSSAYPILNWVLANVTSKHTSTYRTDGTKPPSRLLRSLFEGMLGAASVSARLAVQSSGTAAEAEKRAGGIIRAGQALPVGPGEREAAVAALRQWIAEHVEGYLKVCDPYFGPEELELLKWVQLAKPDTSVTIMTSGRYLKSIKPPLPDAFETEWRLSHSDMNPPATKIIVAGIGGPEGGSPVHDRWWITKGSGVRLGTSLNSLGISKLSEISWPQPPEVEKQETLVDRYLEMRIREQEGKKITYLMFTM